jgi:hypothetical protein
VNKLRTIIALLSAAFFAPILAQADNLWGSSENFQVAADSQPSAYGLEFAKATKKIHATDAASVSDASGTVFDNSQSFLQLYSGLDFSFLEDVVNGSNGWVSGIKATDPGAAINGGGNNLGIQAGALFGIHLDPSNSLALDLGGIFTFGNNWHATVAGGSITQNLGPVVASASLDYILDIIKAPGARTYITAGAGWYHAMVTDELTEATSGGTTVLGGTFTGDTVGGTLGIGEEVDLGGSFGLDISVKGRYASFSKVSNSSVQALDGTGSSSIGYLPTTGTHVVVPYTDAGIASTPGARDAVIDYSGIDAKVALNLYL